MVEGGYQQRKEHVGSTRVKEPAKFKKRCQCGWSLVLKVEARENIMWERQACQIRRPEPQSKASRVLSRGEATKHVALQLTLVVGSRAEMEKEAVKASYWHWANT